MPPRDPPAPEVDTAVAELYALAPEDFVAARDARARALKAGGRRPEAVAVAALKRPTAAAHLLNLLARAHGDDVEGLLDLGPMLREAQDGLDAAGLRALSQQRRAVVDALVRQAVALAPAAVPAPVRGEVQATLEAALLDDQVAGDVRAGRLARAAERAGFGAVPGTLAVAPPSTPSVRKAPAARVAAAPTGRRGPSPTAPAPVAPAVDRAAAQAAVRERRQAERREAAEDRKSVV